MKRLLLAGYSPHEAARLLTIARFLVARLGEENDPPLLSVNPFIAALIVVCFGAFFLPDSRQGTAR